MEGEEGGAGGVDAVGHGFDAALFAVGAGFDLEERVAMETGGDELVGGRVGEQIAGELFDDELVEGPVAVEGVGVAGLVQPLARPAFAELGGGEEAVDDGFVGLGLGGVGREAGEIEGDAGGVG